MTEEIYVTNTETVVENNEAKIKLFGRTDTHKADSITVEGFEDYFYVRESESGRISPMEHDNLVRYEEGDFQGIDNSGERNQIVPLTKVVVKNPKEKESVAAMFSASWEADVDYTDRFRINHDVKTGVKAASTPASPDEIEAVEKDAPPRVLTFDIETDDRGEGFPNHGKARILSIVAHDSYTDEYVGFIDMEGQSLEERFPDSRVNEVKHPSDLGLDHLDKLEFEPDERRMLVRFYSWVSDRDFDVIAGWNSNGFDTPFLVERGGEVGANSDRLARFDGAYTDWRDEPVVKGRSCFDLMDAWKDTKFTKVSGALDSAAEMELDDVKIDHSDKGFYELYDENTTKFLNYNAKDTYLTVGVNEAANVLGFKKALRDTIGLDFEDTKDNKDFITMLVRRKLDEIGLIGPTAVEPDDTGSYDGAYVFEAFKGLKENIVGIDLASLYPNAMWMLNASPETKLGKVGRDFKEAWVTRIREEGFEVAVSSNGVVFCLEEDGMFRELVDEALKLKEHAGEMKQDSSLSDEEQEMWAEEYGVRKTIVNSIYGVLGWTKFFLYDKDIASAITLTGQEVIKTTAKHVNENTVANVAYGDTDSNYIQFPEDYDQEQSLNKAKRICDELNETVYKDLATDLGMNTDVDGIGIPTRFEIELEMYASHFFMSGQKKFYAYVKTWKEGMDFTEQIKDGEGKLSISGYPCKKANTAKLTAEVQRETLETIVRGGSQDEIREIIREGADRIDAGNPDFDLIGIPGGLGKELTEYNWSDNTPSGASPRAAHFGNLFIDECNFGKGDTVKRVYLKRTNLAHNNFNYEVDVIGFERGAQLSDLKDELTVDVTRMQDTLVRNPMVDILDAVDIDVDAAITGQSQSGLSAFC